MKVKYLKIRKIEKAAFLFFAVMASVSVQAQDTTSFKEVKDERVIDSLENLLLEGEYGKSVSADFTFSKFALKKNKMQAHGSGVFFGYGSLASRKLSNIGWIDDAILKYGLECGLTLFGLNARLSKKHGWFLYAGLGWGSNIFVSESNGAFKIEDKRVVQVFPEDDVVFSSNFTQVYIHIPVFIEYQEKFIYFQLGADVGINFASQIYTRYLNAEKERIKESIKTGKYVNPIAVDLKAEIGFFNSFAFYFKYGLMDVFKKGCGPKAIPISVGFIWHI